MNSELDIQLGPDDEQGGMGPAQLNPDDGDDYFALDPLVEQMDDSDFSVPEGLFGEYAGLGAFSIIGNISQTSNFSTGSLGGVIATSIEPLVVESTLKLTYLYAPTPASAVLLGVGTLGLVRRRRA